MSFRVLMFLLIGLTACSSPELLELPVGNNIIHVELAITDAERQTGLMNRDEIPDNHGMLFIFEKEQRLSFWMKNTRIPLSIAYIDKKGKILEIYDMEPYSLESVSSKRSSIKYALEVNKGFFRESGIKVGDSINLQVLEVYLKSSK